MSVATVTQHWAASPQTADPAFDACPIPTVDTKPLPIGSHWAETIGNVVIVIPTYNEADNIIGLIKQINAQSYRCRNLSVLVVDDSSPDGTSQSVIDYARTQHNVYCICRSAKTGIGAAYITGFNYAIKELGADYIMQMDADGSHPPAQIQSIIAKVYEGYPVVIGSRYTTGGSITRDWPLIRYLNSRMCNNWTKWVLGITSIEDRTAGFKIIEASLLEHIRFERFFSRRYSFQVALLYCLLLQEAKITEVPIAFQLRAGGKSKMIPKDLAEFLWHVVRLRASRRQTFIRN